MSFLSKLFGKKSQPVEGGPQIPTPGPAATIPSPPKPTEVASTEGSTIIPVQSTSGTGPEPPAPISPAGSDSTPVSSPEAEAQS